MKSSKPEPIPKVALSLIKAANPSDTALHSDQSATSQVTEKEPSHVNAKQQGTSDSGLPSSTTKPSRLSSSGTPQQLTPRSSAATRNSTPKITPRENRSSALRKSMIYLQSSTDGTSLRASVAAMKENSTPGAVGSELSRLANDLRNKQKDLLELENSAAGLKASLEAKERALSKAVANSEGLKAKAIQAEGDLSKRSIACRRLEVERNKLQSKVQDLQTEIDKLRRKLEAMPKGTGLSEAIALLEGKVESLKAANTKLENDNKGMQNQLRAKNKELDHMALEVAAAREILVQNGELENYILDLRKQLQEADEERATQLHVQRQIRAEMEKLREGTDDAKQEALDTQRELTLYKQQLKASEENASELSRELTLRKNELKRVGAVAAKASTREAGNIREDGMVPFELHKEEVMHLRGENTRVKDKLRLAEKSNVAQQEQLQELFKKLDIIDPKERSKHGVKARTAAAAGIKYVAQEITDYKPVENTPLN